MALEPFAKEKKLLDEQHENREAQMVLQRRALAEERPLTAEEDAQWMKIEARQKTISEEIEELQSAWKAACARQEQLENQGSPQRTPTRPGGGPQYEDVLNKWFREGRQGLEMEERQVLRGADSSVLAGTPYAAAGDLVTIQLPQRMRLGGVEVRAQSTAATEGGDAIPTGFAGFVSEALLSYGGPRRLRTTTLQTARGDTINFPTNDATGQVGVQLDENVQADELDIVTGVKTLNAWNMTSRVVRVSVQLMQDSGVDMGAFVGRLLGVRIGRLLNTLFTTGAGTTTPMGFITAATVGKTSAGIVLDYDDVLDLKHSVDEEYRDQAEWAFNDNVLLELKKLAVGGSDRRPLWQPGVAVGEPQTIDGDPFRVCSAMASVATTNKIMAYGDFSYFYLRDVSALSVLRLDQRWGEWNQVGFVAFSRHDSNLIDGASSGSHAIKTLQLA